MVDDPRDALECFGSSPVDALAIGPFLLTRARGADGGRVSYEIVIPTSGPPVAAGRAARASTGPRERDRRRRPAVIAAQPLPAPPGVRVVLRGPARGPAAARNVGWRAARAEWVAFLDDDVLPPPDWREALDATCAPPARRRRDPGPDRRAAAARPSATDWERNVAGLEAAQWATADMAYRREALAAVGGFDERFPRAYREDADLGLRVVGAGWRIVRGQRHIVHPVGPAPPSISLRKQAGNADDVLMRRLHGPDWRERAAAAPPPGRRAAPARRRAAAAAARGRRGARHPAPPAARLARAPRGAAWLAGTAELAWARIKPGPRTAREVATMAWTSAAMPLRRHRRGGCAACLRRARRRPPRPRPKAVLFDRDGTLIVDVPVQRRPRAGRADARRAGGARPAARGGRARRRRVQPERHRPRPADAPADVLAVQRRMEALLGPFGPLQYCPHGPDDGCACRKPAPGLIAARRPRAGRRPERVRGDRRHRRGRRSGARRGRAADPGAHAGHPRRGGRGRARGRPRPRRGARPSSASRPSPVRRPVAVAA